MNCTKKPRGFAAMDPHMVKLIASLGGKAAHAAGTAHQFNSEEARVAGRKGGTAPHVSRGRAHPIAVPVQLPDDSTTTQPEAPTDAVAE